MAGPQMLKDRPPILISADCCGRCGSAYRNAPAGPLIRRALVPSILLLLAQLRRDQPGSAGPQDCSLAAREALVHDEHGFARGVSLYCWNHHAMTDQGAA